VLELIPPILKWIESGEEAACGGETLVNLGGSAATRLRASHPEKTDLFLDVRPSHDSMPDARRDSISFPGS
jgi:hypothetical protein